MRQANRCVRSAKLVALQLHFLNQGSDLRVINLRPAELLSAVTSLPQCYQVRSLSERPQFTSAQRACALRTGAVGMMSTKVQS